eukprot:CCRYP_007354-RB/>CCRYP_007354-RB protein AED:0.32 eAED:0.31 QI:82/0/0/1/0/0/5/0/565
MHPLHNTDPPTTYRVHTHLRTHDLPTTRALFAFLHATAGYPVKSTWLQAIKNGFYNSWSGLTYTLSAPCIAAYRDIHSCLSHANCKPMVHILDNEASLAFRQAITSNGSTYQLVPPHVHRCNAGERTICTFKDHFLAVLAGTAPSFQADQWDLLIPHAELTLDLLHASCCNPTLSAWEDLFGPFNFDATPMGPAGCCVLIHSKATTRRSWDYRSHEALHHYRCYRVLNKESRAVAITDAIKFRHHYLPSPDLTAEDKIIAALQQLRLGTKSPTVQLQAIYKQRDIFHHYATPAPNPDTTPPRVQALAPSGQALSPRVTSNLPPCDTNPGPASTDSPWQTVPARTWPGPQPMEAQPIAAHTRARLQATNASHNAFAALADTTDDEPHAMAMPVLDQDTGQSLEHKQLRRHPKHKATWDTITTSQRSAKAISLTPEWSASCARRKPTPTAHESPSGATASVTLGTVAPKQVPKKLSNFSSTSPKVSMASNRPENWPMTSSPNAWKRTDTTNVLQPPAFGIINGGLSFLYSSSMTSASNTLTADMLNISCTPSMSTTQSPPTGQAPNL